MYFRLLVLAIFVFLAGCSSVEKASFPISDLPFSPPALDLDASLAELNDLREKAALNKNWSQYILLTEELWLQTTPSQRQAIEEDSWISLQAVTQKDENLLLKSANPVVQQWAWLLEARKESGLNFTRALEDISYMVPDASFNNHLVPSLIGFYKELADQRTLALMLPFSGEYASVSKQIKNGFLKAYWHSEKSFNLIFIDTQDYSSSLTAYDQAKRQGADLVIGPLTPAELFQLQSRRVTDLIALNSLDQDTSFMQFNLRSPTEVQQLVEHLNLQGYSQLGVLSSDRAGQLRVEEKLNKAWEEETSYKLVSHVFKDENPNLRQELATLINASFSQERANYLRNTLRNPLEFFPRVREDLEALVLLGDEKQLSVLRPQLEYFELDLPVYATSNLNTDNLSRTKISRDLKQVIFPSRPLALERTPLITSLEAFGWDAFYLGMNQPFLVDGLHLNGVLGQHKILQNKQIATQLVWAQFQNDGRLQPLHPEKYSYLNLGRSQEDEEEARRLLLEEINQLPFEDEH